ncbi:MAG: hypothetical protein PUC06_05455 [Oscillospiraceae bacterium]|nr:hypothetical protein [Oscillospiraceae bacterium]
MRLKLRERDYVPDGAGGFQQVTDREQLLEQALYRLSAKRGGFSAFPELGSRLYLLTRERPSNRKTMALRYAQEALAPLGLSVTDVSVEETNDGLRIAVYLEEMDSGLEVLTR